MMITIHLNNEKLTIKGHFSLHDVLTEYNQQNEGYAVALNSQFIPSAHHTITYLKDGDRIDIVSPMQGG